jgi:hypothetical protein
VFISYNPLPRDVLQFCGGPVHYEGTVLKDSADSSNNNLLFFKAREFLSSLNEAGLVSAHIYAFSETMRSRSGPAGRPVSASLRGATARGRPCLAARASPLRAPGHTTHGPHGQLASRAPDAPDPNPPFKSAAGTHLVTARCVA